MTFGKASARTEYIGPNAIDLGLSVLWGDQNVVDQYFGLNSIIGVVEMD